MIIKYTRSLILTWWAGMHLLHLILGVSIVLNALLLYQLLLMDNNPQPTYNAINDGYKALLIDYMEK